MDSQSIEIRHSEVDDYRAIRDIHAQPRAVWGTLQVPFRSLASWKKHLEEAQEGSTHLVACAGGRVVGNLGLFVNPRVLRRRHVASIGMAVHDDWQGRGVGTALLGAAVDLADRWLNLTRLELSVYTDNEPAVRLYKRFGFEVEGRLRRFAFRDGGYVDAFTMARLR